MSRLRNLYEALSRKKIDVGDDDVSIAEGKNPAGGADGVGKLPLESASDAPQLARVLGLIDLTMLGVGATLGVGVYVLAGSVARNQAGPSVVISFAIAAVTSLFSGLCYSEFASRISKSGSAYNYTYLSIGEFAAYIIGWNLVLEYIIGTASEAKAISNQIDSLMGNAYQKSMESLLPIKSSFLSSYPDFIAPIFVAVITGLLSWGASESAKVNNVLTFANLGTVAIIVFSGLFRLNPANWTIRREAIPPGVRGGSGGFAPFGVNGIVTGAAKCFFGFVGFDGIATTGEETRNPKRNIPLAIILSLLIVFVCYFSIAVVITMIVPYYEQNADAPFPAIFDRLGWPVMKWLVTVGSLFALFTAMFGAFFPLPRILYAMSRDGLLYERLSYVSSRTQTPLLSTALSGVITAVMSAVFKLDQLVDMMSIGTLLAYIIVAICVLLLRYSGDEVVVETCDSEVDFVHVDTLANTYKDMTREDSASTELTNVTDKSQLNIQRDKNQSSNQQQYLSVSHNQRPIQGHQKENAEIRARADVVPVETQPNGNGVRNNPRSNLTQNMMTEFNTQSVLNGVTKTDNSPIGDVFYLPTNESFPDNAEFPGRNPNFPEGKSRKLRLSSLSASLRAETLKARLRRTCMTLFNTQGERTVTRTSQTVAKVCIYLLVGQTILLSFLLNGVTSGDREGAIELSAKGLVFRGINASRMGANDFVSANQNGSFANRIGDPLRVTGNGTNGLPNSRDQKPVSNVERLKEVGNALGLDSSKSAVLNGPNTTKLANDSKFEGSVSTTMEASSPGEIDQLAHEIKDVAREVEGATIAEFVRFRMGSSKWAAQAKSYVNLSDRTTSLARNIFYVFSGLVYVVTFLILSRQGQNTGRLKFKVPWVPLIPCLSMFMNIYLMINLDVSTWVRFLVWLVLGMVVYFTYSIDHSKQKAK
ncbi:hypothetical protein M8J76_010994 [Diaphorina citri]|nr:hypothetical protein M8J75_004229 [Diaphorina citri]KAI5709135.1 hypothetical protein M8J76_010994 [Diaphorina citri]